MSQENTESRSTGLVGAQKRGHRTNWKQLERDGAPVNCLRCRKCSLLPETDMNHVTPVVFCGRLNDKVPLRISPCGLVKLGDMTANLSEVERQWIVARYPVMVTKDISKATQRSIKALIMIADENNVKKSRHAHAMAIARGKTKYNLEQHRYIIECHSSGFWPQMGGSGRATEKRDAIRATILARLAELGPPMSWQVAKAIAYELTAHSAKKRQRKLRTVATLLRAEIGLT